MTHSTVASAKPNQAARRACSEGRNAPGPAHGGPLLQPPVAPMCLLAAGASAKGGKWLCRSCLLNKTDLTEILREVASEPSSEVGRKKHTGDLFKLEVNVITNPPFTLHVIVGGIIDAAMGIEWF